MKNTLDLIFSNHNPRENFYYFHWSFLQSVHYHSHNDFFEIILPLKSEISHFFNNETELLNEKTIYIISPHYIHNIFYPFKTAKSDPHHFNLAIAEDYFSKAALLVSPVLLSVLTRNNGLTKIPLSDIQYSYILSLTEILKTCNPSNRCNVVTLLLQSILTFLSIQEEKFSALAYNDYALDIKYRIDNLEYIDKSAKEIYAKYPIAFSSLISQFKQLTGTTIIHYLVSQRMEYAKKLLSSTDYSVLQVSLAVGYTSLSHFIYVFKNYYGLTPKAFQLQNNTHITNYQTKNLHINR